MARVIFKEKTWADYDIGDLQMVSQQELVAAVRRAAKAANQRLLRLERTGRTGGIYKTAMMDLVNRKRFKENPKNLSKSALRHEYYMLRSFLSAKTSTIQGARDSDERRYKTAVDRGFTGTPEEFYFLIEKLFTKHAEALFSSDAIYDSITDGTHDLISEAIEAYKGTEKRGSAHVMYLKRKQARKRE